MVKLIISLAIILVFASVANAETITQMASRMVGKPVTVKCVKLPNNYGEVYSWSENGGVYFDPIISLSRDTCEWLTALKAHRIYNLFQQANALATLEHESMHIRLDSQNESKVECVAMKNLWPQITRLGYSNLMDKKIYAAAWKAHWSLSPLYIQTGYGCDNLGMRVRIDSMELVKPVRKQ